MNELFDKYMPLRKVSHKEYKRRFKPWITDNILKSINTKNKIFKRYIKCKDKQSKEQLNNEYKNLKNVITALTRQSKKDYYSQYFTENKQKIKEIINIKSKNYSQPTFILENNRTITEPKEIANSFNKFYTSIADDILKKRKYGGKKLYADYLKNPLIKRNFCYL